MYITTDTFYVPELSGLNNKWWRNLLNPIYPINHIMYDKISYDMKCTPWNAYTVHVFHGYFSDTGAMI